MCNKPNTCIFALQSLGLLPKTSYFKLIDIWLLFCIFLTVLIIFIHAAVDLRQHSERHSAGERPSDLEERMLAGSLGFRTRLTASRSRVARRIRGLSLPPDVDKRRFQAWEAEALGSPPRRTRWCLWCWRGGWCHRFWTCRRNQRMTAKGVVRLGRFVVAVLFIAFNIYYWLTAYGVV